MHGAASSKGLTIQYKAHCGPNPCQHLCPCNNTVTNIPVSTHFHAAFFTAVQRA